MVMLFKKKEKKMIFKICLKKNYAVASVACDCPSACISSILRCVMKRSRICRAGLSLRIIDSTSVFIVSPTNIYLM